MNTELWLIRHGESEANAGLPTTDTSAIALTVRGEGQARQVVRAFIRSPDLLVTSPYRRTKQTAAPLLARFPHTPQAEWPVQEFTYLALPPNVVTTAAERAPLSDTFWARYDPYYSDGPGAESFADLIARSRAFLEQSRALPDGFVAVYTHGLFMRAVLWTALITPTTLTPDLMRRCRRFMGGLIVPNGSIIKLLIRDEELFFSPVLTDHLADYEDEPDVALLT
jgi:2,3-bisphosphoglycerate-dependent phosphoglycerate mutase